MATAETQLKDWFTDLTAFRTCCADVNTDAGKLSMLRFAESKIADLLAAPPSNDQPQFALCASNATKLPVSQAAITAAATFLDLLEAVWAFPNLYIANYVLSMCPKFAAMNVGDFLLQKVNAVFPGGAADPLWIAIDSALAGIIDNSCYSPKQRAAVAKLVADPTKQITDVVNQIAVLG
jgi:hypothetical protein